MTEIKVVAAKLLSKYRLVATPNTKNLEYIKGDIFLLSYEDPDMKLEKR
jgi:hypothetical protein